MLTSQFDKSFHSRPFQNTRGNRQLIAQMNRQLTILCSLWDKTALTLPVYLYPYFSGLYPNCLCRFPFKLKMLFGQMLQIKTMQGDVSAFSFGSRESELALREFLPVFIVSFTKVFHPGLGCLSRAASRTSDSRSQSDKMGREISQQDIIHIPWNVSLVAFDCSEV